MPSRAFSQPSSTSTGSTGAGRGIGEATARRFAQDGAAVVIAAVAVREGRESWRGEGCCDTC